MFLTTRGLVLREVRYKESDKILTVLTQHEGKVTVRARGALRKGVLHASRMGPHPLDALRFATRWWMTA